MRHAAVEGISALMPTSMQPQDYGQKIKLLEPLLNDPIRAVRIEAARALTDVPPRIFNKTQREAFDRALTEYKEQQRAINDRPGAHLNLGVMYQKQESKKLAEESYKTALTLNEQFYPARINLANLYHAAGRNKEAEDQLRRVIKQSPDNREAHYLLGLLLAEMKRLDEGVVLLKEAAHLVSEQARVRYNYALALQQLGKVSEAETEMIKAYHTDTKDPQIVYALVVVLMKQEKWKEAHLYNQKLMELVPESQGPKQLMKRIQENLPAEKK